LTIIFKELRKIIAEKNKALEKESMFYDPNYYWKGRKVISLNHWLKIKSSCGLKVALQYFPNDFPRSGLTFILGGIEDQTLMQEAELWCSDYERLREYSRNAKYGKTKCFHCLISTDKEETGIFIRINRLISRALDTTTDGTSIYPCKILNRFACPYNKKMIAGSEKGEGLSGDIVTKKPDVDYLFYLSELAFAVELALAKTQEEDSVFRIRSAADAYHALTNRETLEMVLQQGLKEEHMKYKDMIVELFTNIKDRIKVEDLRVY
jgi:hypothetical protein